MTPRKRRQYERWAPILEFPDYDVSDQGRVRSRKYSAPRILAQHPNRDGYLCVRLWADNRPYPRRVHSLVARAFIGPRPDGLEVRHLDDSKLDNRVGNLTYGTRSQNIVDAVRNGTQAQAAKTHCPQEHPYDAANTMIRPNGWRTCRTCQSERQKAARARRSS